MVVTDSLTICFYITFPCTLILPPLSMNPIYSHTHKSFSSPFAVPSWTNILPHPTKTKLMNTVSAVFCSFLCYIILCFCFSFSLHDKTRFPVPAVRLNLTPFAAHAHTSLLSITAFQQPLNRSSVHCGSSTAIAPTFFLQYQCQLWPDLKHFLTEIQILEPIVVDLKAVQWCFTFVSHRHNV